MEYLIPKLDVTEYGKTATETDATNAEINKLTGEISKLVSEKSNITSKITNLKNLVIGLPSLLVIVYVISPFIAPLATLLDTAIEGMGIEIIASLLWLLVRGGLIYGIFWGLLKLGTHDQLKTQEKKLNQLQKQITQKKAEKNQKEQKSTYSSVKRPKVVLSGNTIGLDPTVLVDEENTLKK